MKPYLVFAGEQYYPRGGWGDFVGSADTMDEALALVPKDADWHHIVHEQSTVVVGDLL